MVKNEDAAITLLLQFARVEQVLSTGRLMSPEEVIRVTADRAQKVPAGWYLAGEVHPKMFTGLQADTDVDYTAQLSVGEAGIPYLVFAQRSGDWEHRFLVQCVGEDIRRYVRDMRNAQKMLYSLAECDGPQARVISAPRELRKVLPSEDEVRPTPQNRPGLEDAMFDCMRTAFAALLPAALGEGTPPPRHVCLTVVQSEELTSQVQSILARADNRIQ